MLNVPEDFMFMFPGYGPKWRDDMTREELLHVIHYLKSESNFWQAEARANLAKS